MLDSDIAPFWGAVLTVVVVMGRKLESRQSIEPTLTNLFVIVTLIIVNVKLIYACIL